MHILLLTHYFQPENVAPQRRWDELASRFILAGHAVTVVCPPPHHPHGVLRPEHRARYGSGTESVTDYGARVLRTFYFPHSGDIASRTFDHLFTAADTCRRVSRIFRGSQRPDIVVATSPGVPSLLAGRLVARQLGVPLISEMRDAWPDLVTYTGIKDTGTGPVAWAKRLVHLRVTQWQRDAARVVATTDRFAEVLAQRGINDPVVIRNGAVAARFTSLGRRANSDALNVLYMGNMGRSQGLEVAVRAASALRADGLQLRVRFVGHGAERESLRRLNRQLGQPVEILDEVAPEGVFAHYAWADSLLVSLRNWEPFEWTVPSKLYESLATGRHVTGLLAGEAADVLRSSGGGVVVDPGDQHALENTWRALLRDKSRLDIGAMGRSWVMQNASYDELAARYLEVLESALR